MQYLSVSIHTHLQVTILDIIPTSAHYTQRHIDPNFSPSIPFCSFPTLITNFPDYLPHQFIILPHHIPFIITNTLQFICTYENQLHSYKLSRSTTEEDIQYKRAYIVSKSRKYDLLYTKSKQVHSLFP
mmetsp:Transcript_8923/g.19638  ORF Transcript_8923/g.19638 Transcript_8923/m.19638 type:complete len:128 (+) Transcript_8923:735-1118(+)